MTTIGVLGLGLIGGSVALAAQRAGYAVLGWDTDRATRDAAAEAGLGVTEDFSTASLVVLAIPLPDLTGRLSDTLGDLHLAADATITDVGSVKVPVAAAMRSAGLAERYVGGHPMAGTERSGFRAADPTLFTGARWALCVTDGETEMARWLGVAALATHLGGQVLAVTPAEHDAAMGVVSGLPHLLALALAASAVRSGPLVPELAAGSFADLTRVAGSHPTLLRAVTEDNEPAVRAALRQVLAQIDRPWADLVEAGHAARAQLTGPGDARPAITEATVTGAQDLLELGWSGAVIEAVDPDAGKVWHRGPGSR